MKHILEIVLLSSAVLTTLAQATAQDSTDTNAPTCNSVANCQQNGDALVTQGRNRESFASWDKAIQLGGAIMFNVCSDHPIGCERAVLRLSTSAISLQKTVDGVMVFSVLPSQVSLFRSMQRPGASGPSLVMQIAGKNYGFEFFSLSGHCDVHPFVQCPPEIAGGQQTIASYVESKLRLMAHPAPQQTFAGRANPASQQGQVDANTPTCNDITTCQHDGDALLTQGRNFESFASWDKAIQLGGVSFRVCLDRPLLCDNGVLKLSQAAVTLQKADGTVAFSAPPSHVSTLHSLQLSGATGPSLEIQIAGKNYSLEFFSLAGRCDVRPFIQCPPQIADEQRTISIYIANRLRQLAHVAQQQAFSEQIRSTAPSNASQPLSSGDTVVIEGDNGRIRVANFLKYTKRKDVYGGFILEETPAYVISYSKNMKCSEESQHEGCFGINLTVNAAKKDETSAQKHLLNLLGVQLSEFCKLPVIVAGPPFADPNITPGSERPSLCPNGRSLFN